MAMNLYTKAFLKGKQLKDFSLPKIYQSASSKIDKKYIKNPKVILTRVVPIHHISVCILKHWLVLWCNSLMWMLSAVEESRPQSL